MTSWQPPALDLRSIIDGILEAMNIRPELARRGAVTVVVIWLMTWLGWQLVKLLARRITAHASDNHGATSTFREKRAQTVAQLVRSAGRGVLIAGAILLTLNQFFNISTLLGGAAVLGLAVSFGAQSLVKDYFAGFFILLENQFVVGDSIEAAGKSGVVEGLTLRTVTLRDIEGVVHVVPNGQITTLSNKTRGWSRAVVDIGISYDNDIDAVIKVLSEETAAFGADNEWSWKFESKPHVLGVESVTDTGPVIRVLLQTKPGMQGEVAREFRRRVIVRLEREGIKGARAQQTINIHPPASGDGDDAPSSNPPPPGSRSERIATSRRAGVTLRLYNTMTRTVDDFVPIDAGRVSLYTCGPTVYNYAHIGNFRTFLFEDVLRRWLQASGLDVFHVMNLTDVDDKTIRGALAAGTPLREYVLPFIEAFHEDRHYLNMLDADAYPRATDFIPQMIALVQSLLDKGVAYRSDDGSVYFAIDRFPAYGKLSRLDTRELQTGAGGRVSADEYAKENARDFVLWKSARDEDERVGAAWDAPFGRGRPGWHLECSAMALDLVEAKYGRDVLDIHAGGVDLIFPHHEDEIAQSCAHTGEPDFARVWMHGEFLTMAGTKMSKRFGNILTARDLRLDRVDPATVRMLFATTHYRQELDFTDDALDAAREGSRRLGEFAARVSRVRASELGEFDQVALVLKDEFGAAMDDDLNTSRALAALFEAARAGNRLLDQGAGPTAAFLAVWERTCSVLQILPSRDAAQQVGAGQGSGDQAVHDLAETPPGTREEQEPWAHRWALRRLAARQARDFAEADRIRVLLAGHGWEIRDSRDGTATVQRRQGS